MSDLEEDSDIEQDADVEIESDKEDKDIGLSKPVGEKKLGTEYDSDAEISAEDTDDDGSIDDLPIDDLEAFSDDKANEYSELDDKGETNPELSPIGSEIDSDDEDYLQKFEPEYAAKLNYYLEVLDDTVKMEHENPSIGILL